MTPKLTRAAYQGWVSIIAGVHNRFILGGQPTEIQQEIPLDLSPGERRDVAVIARRVIQLFGD